MMYDLEEREPYELLNAAIQRHLTGCEGTDIESKARAIYAAVCERCKAEGMEPEIEVFIKSPEEYKAHGYDKCWCVSWESGPYQWAIGASMDVAHGDDWYTEPYYSFDLNFVDNK